MALKTTANTLIARGRAHAAELNQQLASFAVWRGGAGGDNDVSVRNQSFRLRFCWLVHLFPSACCDSAQRTHSKRTHHSPAATATVVALKGLESQLPSWLHLVYLHLVDLGGKHGSRLGSGVNAAALDADHKVAAVFQEVVRSGQLKYLWRQQQVTSLDTPSHGTLYKP